MDINDFHYHLPEALIAQTPAARRDESRLMVLDRSRQRIAHQRFSDLPGLCRPGDLVILNDSRVFAARLHARRRTGRTIEILLTRALSDRIWRALVKPGKAVKVDETLTLPDGTAITVGAREDDGMSRRIIFPDNVDPLALAEQLGETPLPPYIKRPAGPEDVQRYQTIYAKEKGSVAAPTAGLHFTEAIFQKFRDNRINTAFVTLHVGPGTFLPVRTERIEDHIMHSEFCTVPPELFRTIRRTREAGGRVLAVGTTTTRALETAFRQGDPDQGFSGWSNLFIHHPFTFLAMDALLTNFHLPKSTLLMLVGAFAGKAFMDRAYQEAVAQQYRFYSYGDAMLIL